MQRHPGRRRVQGRHLGHERQTNQLDRRRDEGDHARRRVARVAVPGRAQEAARGRGDRLCEFHVRRARDVAESREKPGTQPAEPKQPARRGQPTQRKQECIARPAGLPGLPGLSCLPGLQAIEIEEAIAVNLFWSSTSFLNFFEYTHILGAILPHSSHCLLAHAFWPRLAFRAFMGHP